MQQLINQLGAKIMSILLDELVKMNASVDGIAGDIKSLNDKIAQGGISAEEKIKLDELQAKLSALDDLNPPA